MAPAAAGGSSAGARDAGATVSPPAPAGLRDRLTRSARLLLGPAGGFLAGAAIVLLWTAGSDGPAAQPSPAMPVAAQAPARAPAGDPALAEALQRAAAALSAATRLEQSQAEDRARGGERLAALEQATRRLEAAVVRAEEMSRRAMEAEAVRSGRHERFVTAMLHLQAAVQTARPWLREYQLAADLAPPNALPRPLAEVLASHAARGLATEADLRERFAVLAPGLVARAPRQGGVVDQAGLMLRSAFATIGLASPPPPSDVDAAVQRIQEQLRRGNLAAAVSDATSLDPRVQPLIGGWLAQARARLAVEQAIQETLLRALARNAQGPA